MRADGSTMWTVGRAVTEPVAAHGQTGDRVTFRLVSTERRFDETNHTWIDGDEFGVNVVCWRNVAAGVLRVVHRGDPVVVSGRMVTRRFERNGATEYFTELKADVVALDLARARHQITRTDPAAAASAGAPVDTVASSDDPWAEPAEPALVIAG